MERCLSCRAELYIYFFDFFLRDNWFSICRKYCSENSLLREDLQCLFTVRWIMLFNTKTERILFSFEKEITSSVMWLRYASMIMSAAWFGIPNCLCWFSTNDKITLLTSLMGFSVLLKCLGLQSSETYLEIWVAEGITEIAIQRCS